VKGWPGSRAAPLLVILAAFLAPGCGAPERAAGPNLLLVTIDTFRADHLGASGSPAGRGLTPHLDAVAAAGTRFARAVAAAPLTLPSHATILTGLLPPHHGVRHNGVFELAPEVPTLPAALSEAGYRTGAVVGAAVLDHRYGLARGFEDYDDAIEGEVSAPNGFVARRGEDVTARAVRWLEERGDEPFFLWVHYFDPHADYAPPEPYASRFRERPYAGEVAYVDEQVGTLLEALEGLGLASGTLVVVTSDHGESLGEHLEPTHAYTLYEPAVAVPLLLRGPGVPSGRVVERPVSLASLAPTLLGLLARPPFPATDGEDLRPWLAAEPPPDPEAAIYSETLATRINHGWAPLYALRRGPWLYIRAPRPELYDRRTDPAELHNLLADAQAAEEHAALVAGLDGGIGRLLESAAEERPHELDEANLAKLRSLGYALPRSPVPDRGTDPKDGLRWLADFSRTEAAFAAGDLERAEAGIERLLPVLPESNHLHRLAARVRMAQGRYEEALHHAERAVAAGSRDPYDYEVLGYVRERLGDVDGAIAAYRRAGAIDPDHSERVRIGLMWGALREGRLEEAERHARRVRELGDDPRARERIGILWEGAGQIDRALAAYREALALDPTSPRGHIAEALHLAQQGAPEEEVARHLEAAGPLARRPQYRNLLAFVHYRRGELARAEEIFRSVLADHPGDPPARVWLARILRATGREAEAQGLEAQPGVPDPVRHGG